MFIQAAIGFGLTILVFFVGAALITLLRSAMFHSTVSVVPLLLVLLLLWWTIPWLVWLFARLDSVLLAPAAAPDLVRRVEQLTESRTATIDAQAAEAAPERTGSARRPAGPAGRHGDDARARRAAAPS